MIKTWSRFPLYKDSESILLSKHFAQCVCVLLYTLQTEPGSSLEKKMQHIRIITQQVNKVFKSVKENYPKG